MRTSTMACKGLPVSECFGSKDLPLPPRALRFYCEDTHRFVRPELLACFLHTHISKNARPHSAGPSLRLLSWGCQRTPLHRHKIQSSCPKPASKSEPFGKTAAKRSHTFRPCRSSRLRRFAPTRSLQVCFTSQPTMGFTTFQTRTNGLLLSTICTGRNLR